MRPYTEAERQYLTEVDRRCRAHGHGWPKVRPPGRYVCPFCKVECVVDADGVTVFRYPPSPARRPRFHLGEPVWWRVPHGHPADHVASASLMRDLPARVIGRRHGAYLVRFAIGLHDVVSGADAFDLHPRVAVRTLSPDMRTAIVEAAPSAIVGRWRVWRANRHAARHGGIRAPLPRFGTRAWRDMRAARRSHQRRGFGA